MLFYFVLVCIKNFMKKDIHPKYYPKAEVECDCGARFTVGSTLPKIHVELCSSCHPFYTGKKRIVDVTGRVEKFHQRTQKTQALKKGQKQKSSKAKK